MSNSYKQNVGTPSGSRGRLGNISSSTEAQRGGGHGSSGRPFVNQSGENALVSCVNLHPRSPLSSVSHISASTRCFGVKTRIEPKPPVVSQNSTLKVNRLAISKPRLHHGSSGFINNKSVGTQTDQPQSKNIGTQTHTGSQAESHRHHEHKAEQISQSGGHDHHSSESSATSKHPKQNTGGETPTPAPRTVFPQGHSSHSGQNHSGQPVALPRKNPPQSNSNSSQTTPKPLRSSHSSQLNIQTGHQEGTSTRSSSPYPSGIHSQSSKSPPIPRTPRTNKQHQSPAGNKGEGHSSKSTTHSAHKPLTVSSSHSALSQSSQSKEHCSSGVPGGNIHLMFNPLSPSNTPLKQQSLAQNISFSNQFLTSPQSRVTIRQPQYIATPYPSSSSQSQFSDQSETNGQKGKKKKKYICSWLPGRK